MRINYPKFDQKISDQIDNSRFQQTKTRPGVISSYDKYTNMATVILDERHSGTVGDILNNVPCPFTYGVQTVAPSPGTRCLVSFRSDSERDPYIINIMNDQYETGKIISNTSVDTGIPKFMV